MPKKILWEMSRFERKHYSLRGKTFRSLVLFFLIISMAAAVFGFLLYRHSLEQEYRVRTWHYSRMAAEALDLEEIHREAEAVISIYDSLPEEERQSDDADYLAQCTTIRDDAFESQRTQLRQLMNAGNAVAAYTAVLDPVHNRMIFLADADPKETFCPPGSWDQMESSVINSLLNGTESRGLDALFGTESIPSVITNMEQYGLRCTAGTKLYEVGDYTVFVFFDTDMNKVKNAGWTFFRKYVILLLILFLFILVLSLRHVRKTVVTPLNEMAEAAEAYMKERNDERRTGRYFECLNIRTGDEIENLSLTMKLMEKDLAGYVDNLTKISAEKERISTELDVAGRIQEGMLPHIYPPFPDRPEVQVYASMDPAKEVGGDFFDYFLIDEDHLCLIMADVSGKGIPAALFMMASKIMLNTYAAQSPRSPAVILEKVNHAICRHNPVEMFVTVWLGILEISSGRLTAASAGHEYPAIRRADGLYEVYKDPHGLVLGGMDGMKYRDYELMLSPGDSIFQYTDGVTEASDAENRLFGLDRMLQALNRNPDAEPRELLKTVKSDISAFAGDAPQFDDITMLCLRYCGGNVMGEKSKPASPEIQLKALTDNLPEVLSFVEDQLGKADCPLKASTQIAIVVEEIFVNIASYAYTPETGEAVIRVDTQKEPGSAVLTFIDSGHPYNPLEREDPDVTAPAEERPVGGLGIYMVKQMMDEAAYEYTDGQNILTLKKKF